jgi:hypothetical protein
MAPRAADDRDDVGVGALVTVELPADTPVLDVPWIITFGPLNDDDAWEPVVCGPYERPHALALAESVVADDELMAVVEPLLPRVSVEEIRSEIAASRLAADEDDDGLDEDDDGLDEDDDGLDEDDDGLDEGDFREHGRPAAPPSVGDVRAGFARIAALLPGADRSGHSAVERDG